MKKVLSFFSALAIIVAGVIPVNYMISATEEDSTDSKIQIIAEDITVDKDDEVFTLLDEVSATDENDEEVEVTVLDDGDFDVTTVGEYTVTYQAVDPSDESEVTKERLVTVEEPEVVVEEETKTTTEETPVKKSLLRAGPVTVSNVTDLVAAVAAADDGDVITLSDSFTFGNATIAMPSKDVVIEGNNVTWTTGTITVNGAGTGSLTIQNLKMNNGGASSRFISATHSAGQLNLNNLDLSNSAGGAVNAGTSGTAKTIINNTRIGDNTANNTAAALWVSGSAYVELNNSTIENNIGYGGGYECGAIASKNYSGTLKINSTILRDNLNRCSNTGVTGGGGGAMSMHYMSGATLEITQSYFKGNETNGTASSTANTYDGGAIYVFDSTNGTKITIDQTTFDSNIASDDGGAILIQGSMVEQELQQQLQIVLSIITMVMV